MTKKIWLLLSGSVLFTLLFYDRLAGINFLLFTVFILGAMLFMRSSIVRNKAWPVMALACISTSAFILWHGSSLAILAWCLSLMLLGAIFSESAFSVFTGLVQSACSVGGSFVFLILDLITRYKGAQKDSAEGKNAASLKPGIILISLFIVLIFFFVYKSANPLFDEMTKSFSPEAGQVFFTCLGLLLFYGLFSFHNWKALKNWEESQTADLVEAENNFAAEKEIQAALIIFSLLDLFLIFIDALDVNYLYLGAGMPKGITHKAFVHNGVGTLVFSIVLGISIILYFFRGALNFSGRNRKIKFLVIAWILLNLFMVVSTALRNKMYTDDALLTYKRIGVYFWLLMAAVGLITALYKILRLKTLWHMLKTNGSFAFLLLVASSAVDWDQLITDYNLTHTGSVSSLDKRYLLSLSDGNIAELYKLEKKPGFGVDSAFHYRFCYWLTSSEILDRKLYLFLKNDDCDWRSFNFRREHTRAQINELKPTIDSLDLRGVEVDSLELLQGFSNLRKLTLTGSEDRTLRKVKMFPKLKCLCLSAISLRNFKELEQLSDIDTLKFDYSTKYMFDSLVKKMPNTKIICYNIEK